VLDGFGIVVPILLATLVAMRRAWRAGLDVRAMYAACFVAACGALVGGNALYLATRGGAAGLDWLRFWAGGQSAFGVLAGGAAAGTAYLAMRRIPVLEYAAAAAPAVALGYAAARLGCLFRGDDFGTVTGVPWAIRYGPGTDAWQAHAARGWIEPAAAYSLPIHPVQFYLAGAVALIFIVLSVRRLAPAHVVAFASLAYGIVRIGVEPLRDDFSAVVGPLSLPQFLALALCLAGVALLGAGSRLRTVGSPAPVVAAEAAR
jgi:phosphatidylglycerol---prolipoprotein diacylglyceryl transferase